MDRGSGLCIVAKVTAGVIVPASLGASSCLVSAL